MRHQSVVNILFHLLQPVWLYGRALSEHLVEQAEDPGQDQLGHGHEVVGRVERDLAADREDAILEAGLLVDAVLDREAQVDPLAVGKVILLLLLNEGLNQGHGRVAHSIYGAEAVYEKVDQPAHRLLALDDEVDVSVRQLDGDAVPAVERQVLDKEARHGVDVLPQHPEARRLAAEDEALDLADLATAAGLDAIIGQVIVNFFRNVQTVAVGVAMGMRDAG